MASSNRHWPSMFKSKPCTHQWQHDINTSSLMSPACQKPPYNSVQPGCEERSPEPKPRWNPRPEQIRILESIFNSGMVNPPRDEIRRIRTRLQEYGQVGDANVFYWFQNRKSRSKHKNRHLQTTTNNRSHSRQTTSAATSSSSSTSSDKSSPDKHPLLPSAAIDVPTNSPTASVNQTNLEQLSGVFEPPFLLQGTAASHGGGYYFSPDYLSNLVQIPEHGLGLCSGLLTELISQGQVGSKKEELKMEVVHPGYPVIANASSVVPTTTTTTTTTTTAALSDLQGGGVGEMGGDRVMVFINDVAFEIGVGPINLREAFGDGAVLLHSSGHPVLTDHLGLTIQPLQHGASYYLV